MAVVRIGSTQVFLCLSTDTKPTTNVPAGSRCWETDRGFWFMYDGSAWTRERQTYEPDTFKHIDAVAITAGTPATIWTPAAGKIVRLLGYSLGSSASTSLEFQDSGAAGTVIYATGVHPTANPATTPGAGMGEGLLLAAADNTLDLDVTVNATISGTVFGREE